MKKAVLLAFLFLLFSNSVEAGIIEVITFPENASVYVNGEYYGQSENGQLNITIKLEWIYKPIIIRVTKEGYSPQNKSIFIFTTEYYARVEFKLVPLNGTLEIVSNPPNAFVKVLGEGEIFNGTTPFKISLEPGNYTVNVTLQDYLPYSEYVEIFPNKTTSRNITLTPLPATLRVFSAPENAEVFVNGSLKGRTPLVLQLYPGKYVLRVAHENYYESTTIVELQPNESREVDITLVPIPAILQVTSNPSNASVYVNGILEGKTPLNITLEPGEYLINVTKDGSWNATTITLEPNERRTVRLTIPEKSNPLGLILAVILLVTGSGAGIYFTKLRRGKGEEIPSKEQILATKEVPFDTAKPYITMKTLDGRAFGMSHVGARENNEDNLLVVKLPDAYLLAVADGLGGHNAGEVASRIAVDTLSEVFKREYKEGMSDGDVNSLLRKAHELAHGRIKENATGERTGMGTTLVTAFVRDGKAIVANTGDSRAYLIRDGKILERTKDHSLVQELLDKGEITEEEAKRHPMRNIITKALGVDFGVDLYEWEIREGDILLLSSDGLHDYVDEGRIIEITSKGKSAEDIVRELIDAALPVTKDNVTVVCLKL